jgi:hypothetical protein
MIERRRFEMPLAGHKEAVVITIRNPDLVPMREAANIKPE